MLSTETCMWQNMSTTPGCCQPKSTAWWLLSVANLLAGYPWTTLLIRSLLLADSNSLYQGYIRENLCAAPAEQPPLPALEAAHSKVIGEKESPCGKLPETTCSCRKKIWPHLKPSLLIQPDMSQHCAPNVWKARRLQTRQGQSRRYRVKALAVIHGHQDTVFPFKCVLTVSMPRPLIPPCDSGGKTCCNQRETSAWCVMLEATALHKKRLHANWAHVRDMNCATISRGHLLRQMNLPHNRPEAAQQPPQTNRQDPGLEPPARWAACHKSCAWKDSNWACRLWRRHCSAAKSRLTLFCRYRIEAQKALSCSRVSLGSCVSTLCPCSLLLVASNCLYQGYIWGMMRWNVHHG